MKTTQASLIAEYGQFLDTFRWKLFSTFTTDYTLREKQARNLVGRLHRAIENKIQVPLTTFWVAEKFRGGNDYHLHALFQAEVEVGSMIYSVKDAWKKVSHIRGIPTQNNYKIDPYVAEKGATYYLCKSIIWKDPIYDFILPPI